MLGKSTRTTRAGIMAGGGFTWFCVADDYQEILSISSHLHDIVVPCVSFAQVARMSVFSQGYCLIGPLPSGKLPKHILRGNDWLSFFD